jgi:hypothetical protein
MGPALAIVVLSATGVLAQTAGDAVPVTPDTFVRAETDMYFARFVKDGALGKFVHTREPAPIDKQSVVRMNRDTVYSQALFDLDAGPVTVTLPDAGDRFMSMQVIDEDQYTPTVLYAPASQTFTRDGVGTRYVLFLVRTLIDPNDPGDIEIVHGLQDRIKAVQDGTGKFEVPAWDEVSRAKVRDGLALMATTMKEFKGAFGPKGQVDPVNRMIGAATGWGGNPDKDATYVGFTPEKNDGTTVYKLAVKGPVPVDGFWSVSVYNAKGFFEKNDRNAYTLNNITAKKADDGSVNVQFGGCDGKIANCLPITNGWNYIVRLYRPRAEILDGTWTFPEAEPAS